MSTSHILTRQRAWLGPLPLRHVRSARCPSRSRHSSFPLSRLFHFIPPPPRHSIQIPTLVAVSESLCFYSQRSLTSVALQTYNDTAAEGKFSVLTLLYCIGDSNEQLALAFQLSQSHGTLSERHAGCCSLLPSGPIGGRKFLKNQQPVFQNTYAKQNCSPQFVYMSSHLRSGFTLSLFYHLLVLFLLYIVNQLFMAE